MISAYVHEFDRFADRSLDFVLIDGMYRGHSAIRAMSKVKPGSLIVIDNANWFLSELSAFTDFARRGRAASR
jgi:predicted O-methyltransferase YrrM